MTRRQLLGAGAGAIATAAGLSSVDLDPWTRAALAAPLRPGALTDVDHVVVLMQENRSFDHYFGRRRGVRGFSDPGGRAAFRQADPVGGAAGVLEPWHLDLAVPGHDCTHDVTHRWGPQHRCWRGGAMDRWVAEHAAVDGPGRGSLTMGYYDRPDLAFYHALADAFTLCDAYHCSVLGPTDPNRLYAMTGTLDPDGTHGGPLVQTRTTTRAAHAGRLGWTTMPEQLSARGVSWKVYTSPDGGQADNVLPYFRAFQADPELRARGLRPTYPGDFAADLAHDRLPQVAWVVCSIGASEHPGRSGPLRGMLAARDVLSALTARPSVWARTALLLTWDENGGFFDHVAPPVAPPGTPGEHLTVPVLPAAAEGVRGPIGLGFRVPLLVVSPFSRGGRVCSDVLDHTSILRFLERRFGAEVPNLSAWRRSVTGDLTSAFSFAEPDARVPRLPAVDVSAPPGPHADCLAAGPVAVPPHAMPVQEPGRARRPLGLAGARRGG